MVKKEEILAKVTFVGLSCLDPADRIKVKEILAKEFKNLNRELKNIHSIKMHFKAYEKDGRKKYSCHMNIEAATGPIALNKMASDLRWNPIDVTHKLVEKAKHRLIHQYKTDSSYRKPYEKGSL